MSEHTGKVVRTITNGGHVIDIGEAIAFTDQPVYLVQNAYGQRQISNYCLTEEATMHEQIEYWKQRALHAESK
jgi:hypothetical protein